MRDRSSSLLALTLLAFFMADVRDGLGPFLATYLQEHQVRQDLIGYTMTAGGLAAVAELRRERGGCPCAPEAARGQVQPG